MNTLTLIGTNKTAVSMLVPFIPIISACQTHSDNSGGRIPSIRLEPLNPQAIPLRLDLAQALAGEDALNNSSNRIKPGYYADEFRLVIPIAASGPRLAAETDRYLQPLLKMVLWEIVRKVAVTAYSDSEGSQLTVSNKL